jgi:hypothetical protein
MNPRVNARGPGIRADQWQFADVEGLPVQMRACDTRLDFTAITDSRWRPRRVLIRFLRRVSAACYSYLIKLLVE